MRAALVALGGGLGLPDDRIDDVRFERHGVSVGTHRVHLSAPRTLVVAIWGDVPGVDERAWAVPPGQWDWVRTALMCDEAVQEPWISLADELLAAGEPEEARLVWLQAEDFATANHRSKGFKALFPSLTAVQKLQEASSAAAFVLRLCDHATAESVVDRVVVARGLLDHVDEGILDYEGKRKERWIARVGEAIEDLGGHREPSVVELSRMLRTAWAACVGDG